MGVLSSNHTKKKMKAPDLRRHPSQSSRRSQTVSTHMKIPRRRPLCRLRAASSQLKPDQISSVTTSRRHLLLQAS